MDTRLKDYRKRANNHQSESVHRIGQTAIGAGTLVATYAFMMVASHEIASGNKSSGIAYAAIGTIILALGAVEILTSRRERNQRTADLLRTESKAGDKTATELLASLKR